MACGNELAGLARMAGMPLTGCTAPTRLGGVALAEEVAGCRARMGRTAAGSAGLDGEGNCPWAWCAETVAGFIRGGMEGAVGAPVGGAVGGTAQAPLGGAVEAAGGCAMAGGVTGVVGLPPGSTMTGVAGNARFVGSVLVFSAVWRECPPSDGTGRDTGVDAGFGSVGGATVCRGAIAGCGLAGGGARRSFCGAVGGRSNADEPVERGGR